MTSWVKGRQIIVDLYYSSFSGAVRVEVQLEWVEKRIEESDTVSMDNSFK